MARRSEKFNPVLTLPKNGTGFPGTGASTKPAAAAVAAAAAAAMAAAGAVAASSFAATATGGGFATATTESFRTGTKAPACAKERARVTDNSDERGRGGEGGGWRGRGRRGGGLSRERGWRRRPQGRWEGRFFVLLCWQAPRVERQRRRQQQQQRDDYHRSQQRKEQQQQATVQTNNWGDKAQITTNGNRPGKRGADLTTATRVPPFRGPLPGQGFIA